MDLRRADGQDVVPNGSRLRVRRKTTPGFWLDRPGGQLSD